MPFGPAATTIGVMAGRVSATEQELRAWASRAMQGDRKASRRLFDEVVPIFVRTGQRTVGPRGSELEDFVQDASIRFFSSLPRFRGQSQLRWYAYRIASLTAADWIRSKSARKRSRVQSGLPEQLPAADYLARDAERWRIWNDL